MKEMPRLSKASEQRISDALTKVAALTADGEDPSDAIVKVATADRLPAEQVRLMVSAYNNGTSLGHIREHVDLAEKAASFPLADPFKILDRMFPDNHKTPAGEKQASAISADYGMAPTGWVQRRDAQSKAADGLRATREKLAVAADVGVHHAERGSGAANYPEYPMRADRKAASALHDLRREMTDTRQATVKAAYDAMGSIDKLSNYFRQVDALPFDGVKRNAEIVLGSRAAKLMDKIAEDKIVRKNTSDQPHIVEWDKAPYSLVKAALDAADTFVTARYTLHASEVNYTEKRGALMRPFSESRSHGVLTSSVVDSPSPIEKQAIGMPGLALAGAVGGTARGMASKWAPASREELIQKQMASLGSIKHEDQLRAINARAMITELMGDKVIGGYSFDEVVDAYNNLAETAPRAMQQRTLAQSFMRKYLEQASSIDPFDSEQMLSVDSKLADRDMPKALASVHQMGTSRELGPPAAPQPKPAPKPQGNIIDEWSAGDSKKQNV
jgi:hypothetical protein